MFDENPDRVSFYGKIFIIHIATTNKINIYYG